MEERGRIIFLISFLVVMVLCAAACLVEVPEGDAPVTLRMSFLIQAAPLPQTVSTQPFFENRANPAENTRLVPARPAPPGQAADRDRNGIPLSRRDYIRAAYIKFPPEGKRG
ncbi:MAG: hypothetical protein FWF47_02515 [Clostridia bacterium]|nr:hypothetical protein [Clostridia bacterium]